MTDEAKLESARACAAWIDRLEQRAAKARARGQVEVHVSLSDLELVLGLAGTATRTVLARLEGKRDA